MRQNIIGLCLILCSAAVCECQFLDWFRTLRRLFGIENVNSGGEKFGRNYDFIVIGAGSGGSVVANRLTENPNWTVLLLEAGKDEDFFTDVPLTAALQSATSYNWGYKSERTKTACLGLVDRRCNLVRGKAVGGTSVINFLLYTRGNRLDFDRWEALGNQGWSYSNVLPYFIKSENCTLCEEIDEGFHGRGGYLHIEHPGHESPLVKLFLKAGEKLGYRNNDPNGRYALGFSRVQATMLKGRRCSASKAFLKPVMRRQNLQISAESLTTKILINPHTKRAFGVEVLKNGRKFKVRAKREVILAAGTINSAQLLMLSGVGPRDELERVGIPVIQDLKVGYNFHDHSAMSTLAFLVNQSVTVSDLSVLYPGDIFDYIVREKGPYTIPGGAEALAFIKTKYAPATDDDYPDMELVLGAGALTGDVLGSLRTLLGIPDSTYRQVYMPFIGRPAFGIATVLLKPKSRGRVRLRDSNPLNAPAIYPNYFAEEEDVAVMVEGIKTAVSIATSPSFSAYASRLNDIPLPGCRHLPFATDAYWACAVRHVSTTLGHHVGTCKMGPSWDPEAVVDPELKVKGVEGLRVVDGSVMPEIVAGHTNAVIYMIGEKASDLIKRKWENV